MKHDDLTPDEPLARALREFDHASEPSPADLRRLASRIVNQAGPMLDRRGQAAEPWWEYAAAWRRTLLELGAATAVVATACIVWSNRPVERGAAVQAVAVARVPNDTPATMSQQLLYAIVGSVEQQAMPPMHPVSQR